MEHQQQPPAFHPLDYISVLRRRIWWLTVPIVLAILVGLALVTYLPRQYSSTTTLGISLPQMDVLSEAQRLSPQERTRSINQVLLSPAVLERVAEEELTDMPLEAAVNRIAGGVNVRVPPEPAAASAMEIFWVDYTAPAPDLAQRVANRLAEVFIEESSRKRAVRYEETSQFIAEQVKQSAERVAEVEAQLTRAKESFMGSLPEQTQANMGQVTSLSHELESTTIRLQSEQDYLRMLGQKLEAYRPAESPDGEPVPAVPTVDARVAELEVRLADLLTRYTPDHAEVRYVRRELDTARKRAAERPAATARAAASGLDPQYQRLLDEEIVANQRVADLQRTVDKIREQLADYRARVDAAPSVQAQIAGLERQYNMELEQYKKLTSELQQAQLTERIEQNQGGEQFTIIARAYLPREPSSPDVPRLMAITVLLGLCLGGALALGREYLDRSIYDTRGISDLDIPVLGEIPRISQV